MKNFGIQIDNNGDIVVNSSTHRMVTGDTLGQNEYLLLMCQKGELKQDPLVGAGIADMLNDNDLLGWKYKIREAFTADGLKVKDISITNEGKITNLSAEYGK